RVGPGVSCLPSKESRWRRPSEARYATRQRVVVSDGRFTPTSGVLFCKSDDVGEGVVVDWVGAVDAPPHPASASSSVRMSAKVAPKVFADRWYRCMVWPSALKPAALRATPSPPPSHRNPGRHRTQLPDPTAIAKRVAHRDIGDGLPHLR